MYDIKRRKQFDTVGDLKRLLADVQDETKIYITGASGWFHIGEVVCLDCEDLEECYEEEQ